MIPKSASGLTLQGLACRRGGRDVFAGLDAYVPAGKALLLAGPNGSGKSSLLRLIAGFSQPVAGHMAFNGAPPALALAYIGHALALKPVERLGAMLENWAAVVTGLAPSVERVTAAAAAFGLEALLDTELRYFSSGQRHRAALARLLVADRPLWLLDEPTVGLDAQSRTTLDSVMQAHLAAGGVVLVASHDPLGLNTGRLDMADYAVGGAAVAVDGLDEVWL